MARPAGYHSLTPYLTFDDANAAFEHYRLVLAAEEIMAARDENGVLRHGELRIGDSPVMLSTAMPQFPFMKSAAAMGGSPMHLFHYCDDADALFARAVAHGWSIVMEMADQSYGRSGGVRDPFGYTWWFTTASAPA